MATKPPPTSPHSPGLSSTRRDQTTSSPDAPVKRLAKRVTSPACKAPQGRNPRPVPADFEARWPEIGWSGAELEWGTNGRVIRRWLGELGTERMAARRRAYLERQGELRARERRKGYRFAR